MKRKRNFSIAILFAIIFISLFGCSNDNRTNNNDNKLSPIINIYDDDQYTYIKSLSPTITMTSSDRGYYFFSGPGNSYLFFLDIESMKAIVLCNKPDCPHTEELDPYKVANCNAFFKQIEVIGAGSLDYKNSSIFFLTELIGKRNRQLYYQLVQISPDGSSRKNALIFKETPQANIFHRGYMYYSTTDDGTISGKENTTNSVTCLYRVPINNLNQTPEPIYKYSGIYASIVSLLGYENDLFFTCTSFTDEKLDNMNTQLMRLSINTLSISEICPNAGGYAICCDKIVYYTRSNSGVGQDYICDLDGKNKKLLKNVIGIPISDDSYILTQTIFMNNLNMVDDNKNPIKSSLHVYDISGNMIQSFDLGGLTTPRIAGTDSSFIFIRNSESNEYGAIDTIWAIRKSELEQKNSKMSKIYEFVPDHPFPGILSKES